MGRAVPMGGSGDPALRNVSGPDWNYRPGGEEQEKRALLPD